MNSKLKIKYVDQRWDGVEGWLGNDNLFWIRLDFFLEYFISGNLELSKRYKNKELSLEKYCERLFEKFNEKTFCNKKFEYTKYTEWLNMKNPKINEVIELFNK